MLNETDAGRALTIKGQSACRVAPWCDLKIRNATEGGIIHGIKHRHGMC